MSICHLSAEALHEKFLGKELTATQIAEAFLGQIESYDRALQSLLTVDRAGALQTAADLDSRLSRGMDKKIGRFAGVPFIIKDMLCTKGLRTTAASKILANFIPPYDATAVQRIRQEGGIILGKSNLDEFAMGSSTENSAFQKSRNPWDLARTPGGSSGGTAAAIAARFAPMGLGTDTGGSIREPAAFCGIVGMKPTYGRVSRYGVIAFASSFDQVGPMTHTVRDAAYLLNGIAGRDMADMTTHHDPAPNFLEGIENPVSGMTVGIPREFVAAGLDAEIRASFDAAVASLKSLGVNVIEVSLPHTRYGIPAYYIVAIAEASSNLARYDGIRYGHRAAEFADVEDLYKRSRAEGFGPEVKRRIMLGTFALSSGYYDAYYDKALRVRRLIKQDFDAAFQRVDAILSPTAPFAAFKLGEKAADPLAMYACDVLTVTANLAGIPGISIPCGFTTGALPIGLQLLGKAFDEATILRLARAYEKANPAHTRLPGLVGGGVE